MNIADIERRSRTKDCGSLLDMEKYARTIDFQRKVDDAMRTLDNFYSITKNPVISCGGGKDGTAVALLSIRIGSNAPIVCADPPNPLPDREQHKSALRDYLGVGWSSVPYDWDVEAVLSGDQKYPEGLKMRELTRWSRENDVDGVVFGIRAVESRSREVNLAVRGEIYKTPDGLRCQPIAKWTAQDSICLALRMGAPINPVYEKMGGVGDFEQLHDGTWWPHGFGNRLGWMRKYYPDYADRYERALLLHSEVGDKPCQY